MEFRDPFAVLDGCMRQVHAAKPHVVILAWHNGFFTVFGDLPKIMRRHPGIDVVLGGHSHQEIPGRRIGKKALFVQPGAHGHAAGVVEIATDDATGRITRVTSKLIRGNPAHPDPEIAALEKRLELECRGLRARELGDHAPPRPGERNAELGKLSAEALCTAANADAAVIWLGTGERINGRRFTYGDLYELLPHRNELCVLTVTRDELAKFVIEHDKLVRGRNYPQLPFASGMKIHRAGNGEVTRIEAPEKLTLAVNDYLISDNSVLRILAYRGDRNFRRLGVLERDAVAEYLASPKKNETPR